MNIKILLSLGILYSTLGIILLFQVSPLLSVVGFLAVIVYLFNRAQKEKSKEFYWLFIVLILALGLTNLYNFTRDLTETRKCLIVNKSYPQTAEYNDCVSDLTVGEYLETLVSVR